MTLWQLWQSCLSLLFHFVQWQWAQRARRCRYNSFGSRLSVPRASGASIATYTGTHVTSAGSGSPCSNKGRRLFLHSEQQLCSQPRAYVALSQWTTTYINSSSCNVYDHSDQLNRMYVCQKSQAFSNEVPTRNQSPHINTSQQGHWSQQRSLLHQNWKDYIVFSQQRHENKTEIPVWTNRNVHSVSLWKWLCH